MINFLKDEKSGGLVLILCTILSLTIANSAVGHNYIDFWHINLGSLSIEAWINDALMTIFFLMIGLELVSEIHVGEFAKPRNVLLPMLAAIGGMLIPAGLYLFFNVGLPSQLGMGIPMATDIAFALGILSLLGKRVPPSLKIFLMTLAVIDDLGAIIMIAVFYTKDLIVLNLFVALAIFVCLIILNRLKVYILSLYLIGGVVMWYFMLQSGVHPTITGVLLAFVIPFSKNKEKRNLSSFLLSKLHVPVSFLILPIFALANTAVIISLGFEDIFHQPVSLGILFGLVVGKPLGIFFTSLIVVTTGLSQLPQNTNWHNILGVGFLGGIGFTMSIFITLLAFEDALVISTAKISILLSSLIAGVLGFVYLKITLKKEIKISSSK